MVGVRTSAHRWRTLSRLLAQVERAFEGTARLDAYDAADDDRAPRRRGRPSLDVCERLEAIEARLDREVDRLTAELLTAQLSEKIRRETQVAS